MIKIVHRHLPELAMADAALFVQTAALMADALWVHSQPPPAVEAEAKRQGIQICTQRIIYRLLEEVRTLHLVLLQGVQPSGMQRSRSGHHRPHRQ